MNRFMIVAVAHPNEYIMNLAFAYQAIKMKVSISPSEMEIIDTYCDWIYQVIVDLGNIKEVISVDDAINHLMRVYY